MKMRDVFVLGVVLLAVGCDKGDVGNLAGGWISKGSHAGGKFLMQPDGRFTMEHAPLSHVCDGVSSSSPVQAEGRWEKEGDEGRVLFVFSRYSDARCKAPYAIVAFRGTDDELSFFLDVDSPESALVFFRDR
ncbi:hypothetical protein K4L06_09555 [Lysobacter sp. BMK333-48F3]|uniref:hypothetical protein n=1 Tax=Lysobacter sp. BMK333-48F3 TaxID=2867962 RepID=UPI001C8BFEB7|nr:hypothetical protein [Lysobacter sp. BMK333-48F3]MBX9401559.1 hypothetical protein [Lysobacter sp. BMK333-48F3]